MRELTRRQRDIIREILRWSVDGTDKRIIIFNRRTGKKMYVTPNEVYEIGEEYFK